MNAILITGSDKGLGLEFTRQYLDAGWRVHASCRRPDQAELLQSLDQTNDRLQLHKLDVTDPASIKDLANALRDETLDVLLNNAGTYGDQEFRGFGALDYERWEHAFRVNTMGPIRVSEALLPQVSRSKKRLIVMISTKMASLSENTSGGAYLYRSSKAGLNAAAKSLALDLHDQGIGVLLLHPGWVQTDMGGESAPLPPQASIRGMREIIDRFTLAQTGHFFAYDGQEIPW
ncbi:SDR family oxidoreductase [Thermithiobacillus plumbiphilus]|uniref:SDR family oxidoreductase n=1 Tax=Thermithiobacillus plumbiphilus TaxID=1729899 RepID=A0ABU9DCE8_9PROT